MPTIAPVTCPLHAVPMIYVGRVPTWENRLTQSHAWHCPKCSIEIQQPITPESPSQTSPQTTEQ